MNNNRFSNILLSGTIVCTLLLTACGGAAQPTSLPAEDVAAAGQALLAKIPAPDSNQPQVDKTYVGAVKGTESLIGLVVQNDIVAGYICNGSEVSQWFTGKVSSGKVDVTNAKGARLIADVSAASIVGTVTLSGGQPLSFTTAPTVQGVSGLFRQKSTKDNVTSVLGWVVTTDSARGLTELPTGAQNGIVLNAKSPAIVRIFSDDKEYAISYEGIARGLHARSVLELSISNPGETGFDVFCGAKRSFFGVTVPKGTTVTVNLNAECAPQAGSPEPTSSGNLIALAKTVTRTR